MSIEEGVKERPGGVWLELANGGGVMFRDNAELPMSPPPPYKRQPKQLLDAGTFATAFNVPD